MTKPKFGLALVCIVATSLLASDPKAPALKDPTTTPVDLLHGVGIIGTPGDTYSVWSSTDAKLWFEAGRVKILERTNVVYWRSWSHARYFYVVKTNYARFTIEATNNTIFLN